MTETRCFHCKLDVAPVDEDGCCDNCGADLGCTCATEPETGKHTDDCALSVLEDRDRLREQIATPALFGEEYLRAQLAVERERVAISDIHDARVAELEQIRVDMIERARKAERERDEAIAAREELSRRYAALEVNYEEALTFRQAAIALGRERDEARAALAKTEQAIVDKLHCDMAAIVRLPCPHVEGRDQRIAELEAALRQALDWMHSAGWKAGIMDTIRAALSPVPAQEKKSDG